MYNSICSIKCQIYLNPHARTSLWQSLPWFQNSHYYLSLRRRRGSNLYDPTHKKFDPTHILELNEWPDPTRPNENINPSCVKFNETQIIQLMYKNYFCNSCVYSHTAGDIIIIIIIIRHAPCQCVTPLATNSLHSGLSMASSIASSKVRLCRDRSLFKVAIQEV